MQNFDLYLIHRHEHSKAAQMVARANSVIRVGLHHTAATGRPCPSIFRGIPEHTGVVKFIQLENKTHRIIIIAKIFHCRKRLLAITLKLDTTCSGWWKVKLTGSLSWLVLLLLTTTVVTLELILKLSPACGFIPLKKPSTESSRFS